MTPTDRDLPKTLDGAVSAILDDCLPEPGLCEMHGRACEVLAEHRAYLEAGLIRGLSAWADRWTRGEVAAVRAEMALEMTREVNEAVAEERAAVLGRMTEEQVLSAAGRAIAAYEVHHFTAATDADAFWSKLSYPSKEHYQGRARAALAAVAALLGAP